MCTQEEFARLREVVKETAEQYAENSRQIAALQKADAVQSEQLKTLFNTTREQGENQKTLLNRLVFAVIGILFILVFAVIFGALGERGFNAVANAAPTMISPASAGH